MMFVINNFGIYDLNKINWSKTFSDQGIDSLDSIGLITSFEHEFHTVFEDNVFDHFESLDEVKLEIMRHHNAF